MDETLIETERLILRKPIISDSEDIFYKYAQDSDVIRFLTWESHKSIEETKNFIESCISKFEKERFLIWCITKKENAELIGMIHLIFEGHKAEFGYVLIKSEWGKGFITEALQRIIELGFTFNNIYRIFGVCDIDNIASVKVMEKSGLVKEGILKRFIIHPNISSEPRDVYLYSIVK